MAKHRGDMARRKRTDQSARCEEVLHATAELYVLMCVLDLEEQTCEIVRADARIPEWPMGDMPLQQGLNFMLRKLVTPESLRTVGLFVGLASLPRRLQGERAISELFHTRVFGWCKATFVRMGERPLHRVLLVIEDVNEQMGLLRERQGLLAENRELHGIVDALMSEYASVCAVDLHTGEVDVLRIGGSMETGLAFRGEEPTYPLLAAIFIARIVEEEDRDEMFEFLDPERIEGRIAKEASISKSYRSTSGGYGEVKVVRVDERTVLMGFTERRREIEELHERLYTDSLSKVRSRMYYDERLAQQDCQALVMADIDRFKDVNDGWGHQCGDDAIVAVAEVIGSCVRGTDEVVRYGGDEFLVTFHGIGAEVLAVRLEQIRTKVAAIRLEEYPDLRLTMSIGAACGSGQVSDMVAVADKALYESKAKRNAVTILPYPPQ